MKKRNSCLLLFILSIIQLTAQTTEKKVRDAFLIWRMAEKFHVQPRPLNDQMSDAIYIRLLEGLDGVFNEDYKKIVDVEELAEQSVDEMQVYILLQEKVSEKLQRHPLTLKKIPRNLLQNIMLR